MGAEYLDALREAQGLPPLPEEHVAVGELPSGASIAIAGNTAAGALAGLEKAAAGALGLVVDAGNALVKEVAEAIVPAPTPQPEPAATTPEPK